MMKCVKTRFAKTVLGALVLCPAFSSVRAEVFNDAAVWIREFRDLDGDGGIDDARDVPDARNVNAASAVKLYGTAANRVVSRDDTVDPYTGREVRDVSFCNLPQPLYVSPVDNQTAVGDFSSFGILEENGGGISVTNGKHTCMMRLRPDWMLHPNAQESTMWVAGGIGFQLGLKLESDGRLRVVASYAKEGANSYATIFSGVYIHTNVWADVVTVMDDTFASFYAITNGGIFQVSRLAVAPKSGEYRNFHFGNYQETKTGTAKAPHTQSYRGSISRVAFWNRALSEQEVRKALAFPAVDVFRLGIENGSSGEFGAGTPQTEMDAAVDVNVWSGAPSGLHPDVPVAYTFIADAVAASLPQALRLSTVADSPAGALEVSLNGVRMPDLNAAPGLTTSIHVPADALVAGENTLILTCRGGGSVLVDAMALGGSVQIGESDDSYAGFVPVDSSHSIARIDGFRDEWSDVDRDIGPEQTNEVRMSVAGYVARRHKLRFEADLWTASNQYEGHEVTLLVNGVKMLRLPFGARHCVFSAEIPPGVLHAGENGFAVVAHIPDALEKNRWLNVDCYRLSVLEAPVPFCIVIR